MTILEEEFKDAYFVLFSNRVNTILYLLVCLSSLVSFFNRYFTILTILLLSIFIYKYSYELGCYRTKKYYLKVNTIDDNEGLEIK